jgi:hypothetical protein
MNHISSCLQDEYITKSISCILSTLENISLEGCKHSEIKRYWFMYEVSPQFYGICILAYFPSLFLRPDYHTSGLSLKQ